MSFWGLTLESGKKYAQKVETSFRLSMAALDPKSADNNSDVSVVVSVEKNEYLMCTLSKQRTPQQYLNLCFQAGETIAFMTRGKGVVHLTGFLALEDDFSMMPSDEEDEEGAYIDDEDDEEQLEAQKSKADKKRKLEQLVKLESKKQKLAPKNEVKDDEMGEEEEDSDLEEEEEGEGSDEEGEEEEDESGEEEEDDDDDDSEMWDDEADEGSESDDEAEEEEAEEEEEAVQAVPKSKKQQKLEQQKAKTPNKTPLVNGTGQPQSGKKKQQESPQKGQQTPKGQKTPKGQNASQTPKGQNASQTPKGQNQKEKPGQTPKTPKTPGESPQKRTVQGGVQIEDIVVGNGPVAKNGKSLAMYYEGRLKSNNKMFDSSLSGPPFKFRLGANEVIKGWDVGIQGMKVGGKRKITIPPHMGYGAKGSAPAIPPNSTLCFEVELKSVS